MPAPFILGGLVLTGIYGIKRGLDAKEKMDKVKDIEMSIQEISSHCNEIMKTAKNGTTKELENLGREKLTIMSGTMHQFVDTYKNMKNVNFKELGIDELENFKPETKEIATLNVATLDAVDLTVSGVRAVAASTLLAAGTYGAVMYGGFAAASTGTLIGTLSGAAATNATLAWLGGGSLAAGGLGMTGGMVVLGGLVAGPALALGGVFLDSKAEDKLYEALEQKDEAIRFQKEIEQAVLALQSIGKRSIQIEDLLKNLNVLFDSQITKFKTIVELLGYNYAEYPEKAKHTVAINAMLAKIIKIIIDTPLLTEKGDLTTDSLKVISRFETISEKTCENKDRLVTYINQSTKSKSAVSNYYKNNTGSGINKNRVKYEIDESKIKNLNDYLKNKIKRMVDDCDAEGLYNLAYDFEESNIEVSKLCYQEAANLNYSIAANRLKFLEATANKVVTTKKEIRRYIIDVDTEILSLLAKKDAKGLFDLGCDLEEEEDLKGAKKCYKAASDLNFITAYNRLRYLESKGL